MGGRERRNERKAEKEKENTGRRNHKKETREI